MMLIDCPWCGPREQLEFRCGGESHIQRPGPAEEISDETWGNYLFFRDNPKGVHFERWHHLGGCGLWFNVARDTVTHRIYAVYPMDAPKPAIGKD
ncbi:sarcosine oxidase subunit delta [Sphingosinicella rhizophila]|uniref:Sarcosine oxidase subunit delta n=1 Tax=Sphingosinicella rhizophila TaxID=3050082 RepID=A0ABU3QA72_9SPHN|nr:sarcosine oxidase subunit delta [Sphingosinicella sp. GR2756]MDT9600222.1 sarcosine oxidase subunit delta [Sphingosinicella sp. GR2756]